MNVESKEKLTLIANRKPPGDQWVLEGETVIRKGIAEALQAWFEKSNIKADFRLEPLKGKLGMRYRQMLEFLSQSAQQLPI